MNRFIVMGRIASDLNLQTTPNGINFCKFRIAVERNFQQKGEEKKTDFFNAVAWRGTAELLTKYFAKGRMITCEVTNNANDTKPVWEDCTAKVKAGSPYIFSNKTAANGFAFNFRISAKRGASNAGGYITGIEGGFE